MMKKLTAVLLALLLVSVCALADGVPALGSYDIEKYADWPCCSYDEASGEWAMTDYKLAALLDSVAAGDMKTSLKDGVLLFGMRMTGNAKRGTLQPELEVYYCATTPIGLQGVSFQCDRTSKRYVFSGKAQSIRVGDAKCEYLRVPMDNWDFAGQPSVTVILHGASDAVIRTVSESSKTAREKLEGASLACFNAAGLFPADAYAGTGVKVGERVIKAKGTDDLIVPGDKGDRVKNLQKVLAANGFYAGTDETVYGAKTRQAVERAQAFYDLPATGSADGALTDALRGETKESTKNAKAPDLQPVGSTKLALTAWRTAQAGIGVTAGRQERTLVLCTGLLCNEGNREISLGWDLQAELIVNGDTGFTCLMKAVADDGSSIVTGVLPLETVDLQISTEVPCDLIARAESLELLVHAETEELRIVLDLGR